MTVQSLRVYAWPDELLQDATGLDPDGGVCVDPTYGYSYASTRSPGHPVILAPWFIIRQAGDPGPPSNHIYWRTPTGAPQIHNATLVAGGYSADTLSTELETRVAISGFSASYSTTTQRWTLSASVTFDLLFSTDEESQALGNILGFGTSDQTGASSYTGDPVVCQDAQPLIWDLGARDGSAIECVMVYAAGRMVGSADNIRIYGSNANLGGDWRSWEADAAYKGASQDLHDDGVNHLHLWFPADDGQSARLRYWSMWVFRAGSATAATRSAYGVCGMWDTAWYDGDYSFSAPWAASLVDGETALMSPAGGGYTRSAARESYRVIMPFRDWPGSSFRELARLRTNHGKDAHLFVADASSVVVDNAVFGVIDSLSMDGYHDVEEIADFTLEIQQVPMEARGDPT